MTLLATLLIQIFSSAGRGEETTDTLVGDAVPSVDLTRLDEPAVKGTLPELLGSGCGYVYFFDVDCWACQAAVASREFVPPLEPSPGVEFVVWVALDHEADRIVSFLAPLSSQPSVVLHPTRPEDLRDLGVPAIPMLWKVQAGILQAIARGQTETSGSVVAATDWLSCG